MTFAVIKTGGKQYKVSPGQVFNIEKINIPFQPENKSENKNKKAKKEIKKTIEFDDLLSKRKVVAEIEGENKGPKISILKFKNKTRYTKRIGHRQKYTQIKILEIK